MKKPLSGTPQSVEIDGVRYPSLADAARALGITRQAVSDRVARNGHVFSSARRPSRSGIDWSDPVAVAGYHREKRRNNKNKS